MNQKEKERLRDNFGNVYGTCVSIVGKYPPNMRVYELKPLIPGKFGLPIRVLTTFFLRIGSTYAIRGVLETIELNGLNVPVLMMTKVTEIRKDNIVRVNHTDDFNRVAFASFIYVEDLTVMSIARQTKETILTLRKEKQDSKYIGVLNFASMTTYSTREDVKDVKVGDKINIFGAIHRDRKYDKETKVSEVGVKLFLINPTENVLDDLLNNVKELHTVKPIEVS